MEDNEKLLKIAIHLHYRDNPKIITDATEVIQNYCGKDQTHSAYDKVLKALHDIMNDLPPNILLYFLTTVPFPTQEDGSTSTFSELIKKSRVSLLDNMQSVLTEYINNAMPSLISVNAVKAERECELANVKWKEEESKLNIKVEQKDSSTLKRKMPDVDFNIMSSKSECPSKKIQCSFDVHETSTSCLKLLEICAEYVVSNLSELRQLYNNKNKKVWSLINRNMCSTEEKAQCYKHIEDVNRKLKWLRMIEAGHISVDVIRELYGDSEIFLKERHLSNLFDESVFAVSKELKEAIQNFVNG